MQKHKARIAMIGGDTMKAEILLALNATLAAENCEIVALNFEMPTDGSAPEWLQLIPAGPVVVGRDGRTFVNDAPQTLLDAYAEGGMEIPIDWEHSTELRAPEGKPAPAAAWVKEMEVRDGGSIWGRVEWTPKGLESVGSKEYKYLSPVFHFDRASLRIVRISSAGLTNRPNLRLQALNHRQPEQKETTMDLKQLLILLGLPETATAEMALNAIGKLKGDLATALNRADTPPLDKFVPRADYDAALNRAATSEQLLATQKKADLELAINAAVDAAVVAGKVTPGTKDYYVGMCRQEGGLDAFKKFVEAAPVVGKGSDLDGKKPEGGETALNAEEKKIAEMFGNSADDLKKYGAA